MGDSIKTLFFFPLTIFCLMSRGKHDKLYLQWLRAQQKQRANNRNQKTKRMLAVKVTHKPGPWRPDFQLLQDANQPLKPTQKPQAARKPRQRKPKFNPVQPVLSGGGAYKVGGTRFSSKTGKKKENQEKESKSWWEEAAGTVLPLLGKVAMSALTGFGDYEVTSNSVLAAATDGDQGSQIPMMVNTKDSNIIQKREFLGNIVGSTDAYHPQTYYLNPGLDDTFPWGFPIANCFGAYQMMGLVLEFKSLATEFSDNTYMGYVAAGTQYNVIDPTFSDKESLENSLYANSCKPSENLIHPIECAPQQIVLTELYIRAADYPPDADPRFYDLGKTTIASGGQAEVGILGELWATYQVRYLQPLLAVSKGTLINTDVWFALSPDASNPLGLGTHTQRPGGTMPGSNMSQSGYQFPTNTHSGTYLVDITWDGTDVAVVQYPNLSLAGCELQALYKNTGGATIDPLLVPRASAVVMPVTHMSFVLRLTGNTPYAFFILDTAGLFPAAACVNLVVTQIPQSLFDPAPKKTTSFYAPPLKGVDPDFYERMRKTRNFVDTQEYRDFISKQRAEKSEKTYENLLNAYDKKKHYTQTIELFSSDSEEQESPELEHLRDETNQLRRDMLIMKSNQEYMEKLIRNFTKMPTCPYPESKLDLTGDASTTSR